MLTDSIKLGSVRVAHWQVAPRLWTKKQTLTPSGHTFQNKTKWKRLLFIFQAFIKNKNPLKVTAEQQEIINTKNKNKK